MTSEIHKVRVLLPEPRDSTIAEQLAGLDLAAMAGDERPYLVLNFAATVDGRATIDGRSGKIGSDADTEMLVRLRTRVEAVMIGAGTMRAERYGPMPDGSPLVIVSNRFDLPWDAAAFTEGKGEVVVFTAAADAEAPETAAPVTVVRHGDGEGVDLAEALAWLRRERGIQSVLCEGGPVLHGELQARGLADELFLTIAPKLAGREERSILAAPLADVIGLELLWLLEADSELFARYRRR